MSAANVNDVELQFLLEIAHNNTEAINATPLYVYAPLIKRGYISVNNRGLFWLNASGQEIVHQYTEKNPIVIIPRAKIERIRDLLATESDMSVIFSLLNEILG